MRGRIRHKQSYSIASIIKAFAGDSIDVVLARKRNVNSDQARRKVDGRTEARLIEIACGPAPEGIADGLSGCLKS